MSIETYLPGISQLIDKQAALVKALTSPIPHGAINVQKLVVETAKAVGLNPKGVIKPYSLDDQVMDRDFDDAYADIERGAINMGVDLDNVVIHGAVELAEEREPW